MTHEIKVKTYRNRPELSHPAENPLFPGQHEGEEVLLTFRHHPVIMRKGLILGLLMLPLGTLPTLFFPDIRVYLGGLLAGIAVGLLLFAPYWVRWYFSVFVLSSERLVQIQQLGFFERKVAAMFHARIHGVDYSQNGVLETMLHYGTIHILTEVGNFDLKTVPHPEALHQEILEAVRDHIGDDD